MIAMNQIFFALSIALVCLGNHDLHGAEAAAVMSVDLGSEWMKVAVVSPGVPMEIVLNRESKRKTPAILAFRDSVRTFGEDAMTVGIRDPSTAYVYLLDLLGKTIDNPIVDLYRKRFPYYEIEGDPKRQTVVFKRSDSEKFSVEELIAQMLLKAKEYTQESTGQIISECVLTVPGYFGQAEREALLTAARLANLKVLQLINDYTAVALHYGVFNRAEINETAQYIMFYDMGAYSTTATVVSYQLVKDKHTKEILPQVQIVGVGFDRTLGGLEVQLRLRDHLAAEFNAMKKTTTDVTSSTRALAKLFKEAGRVKNVLSANADHYAQIENLLEDHDFKIQVTREQLEEMCSDLWPRVTKPLEQALAAAHLNLDSVSQVILFGGGTRVPKVKELIRNFIKEEPGKSLNADEAAAMGAVYKAADLATGFKVKKFIIKDSVLFPIHVTFARASDTKSQNEEDVGKSVKRVLFNHMNAYPQKKVITFNKHMDDFEFYVHYGDLDNIYTEFERSALGQRNISRVTLQHVKELLNEKQSEVAESKGIKAYFTLDESGVFQCAGVEYVYEKQYSGIADDDEESTLSKLGSTISKLFAKEEEHQEKVEKESEDHKNKKNTEQAEEAKEDAKSEKNEKNGEEKGEKREQTLEEIGKNETVKLVTVKVPIDYTLDIVYAQPLAGDAFKAAAEKLNAINREEEDRNRLQSSFNALESHVIETQQKLTEEEYSSCLNDEEKKSILEECNNISEWLYEDVENPTPDMYEKRLAELKDLTNVFMRRHWEHEERPEALKSLDSLVENAKKFLKSARNLTKETNPEKDIFTQVEIDVLSKTINETVAWQRVEIAAQKKLKRNEDVRLTVKDIADKMQSLDREVKYLVNKLKLWRPKPAPKKEKPLEKNQTETDAEAKEAEETVEEPSVEESPTESTDTTTSDTIETTSESTPRSDL